MDFFRRLTLRRFIKAHPPSRQVSAAPGELIAAYKDVLPESLLQLWRRKGLGFYGELQLALIDPRLWQPVLDRWIVSPPDTVRRTPIALTPFGVLLYHRRHTATDEDVVYIDPVSTETGYLASSVDDLFNGILCEKDRLESLVSPALVHSARQQGGVLGPGEVYEIDKMLLLVQALQVARTGALHLHRRLRDAIDPPRTKAVKPTTVSEALPDEYRSVFMGVVEGPGLAGLYLSSYIDWHRLLALREDGKYRLLFWRIHDRTYERTEVRWYSGLCEFSCSPLGDETVSLDIALRRGSCSSDDDDHRLIAMQSGGATFLLRAEALEDMATAMGGRRVMGRSEHYFRRVRLDHDFRQDPSDGCVAPVFEALPPALGESGAVRDGPVVGDILTTRSPQFVG
jgi:hypothetical protein